MLLVPCSTTKIDAAVDRSLRRNETTNLRLIDDLVIGSQRHVGLDVGVLIGWLIVCAALVLDHYERRR